MEGRATSTCKRKRIAGYATNYDRNPALDALGTIYRAVCPSCYRREFAFMGKLPSPVLRNVLSITVLYSTLRVEHAITCDTCGNDIDVTVSGKER